MKPSSAASILFVLIALLGGSVVAQAAPPTPSSATQHQGIALSAAGSWSQAADMGAWRSGHTATLLPSGKVLVTSGSTCELYDRATNSWSWGGPLQAARGSHTATLLPSGKVLAVGGRGLASAELYDPASDSWTLVESMYDVRYLHTATLLPSGQVLAVGGQYYHFEQGYMSTASADLYDPEHDSWVRVEAMGVGRYFHTATLLPSGKVLVVGGVGGDTLIDPVLRQLASAELYDPSSDTWTPAASMSTPRYRHTATLLPSGQVLVAGGRITSYSDGMLASAEVYDPATDSWRTVPNRMLQERANHTATLLPSGQVLLARGTDWHYKDAERYDPASDTWIYAGYSPIYQDRHDHTATLLPSGQVLITGGTGNYNGSPTSWGALKSAELYTLDPPPNPRLCLPLLVRGY